MSGWAVVDASVAARWVLHVPGREDARKVLAAYRDEEIALFAPPLQRVEVASAIWKYHRAGLIDRETMDSALVEYLENAPLFRDSGRATQSALDLAAAHDRSVYDCLYLALSLELRCELLTADKKFFRAMGATFPQIHLVGD